MKIGIIGAGYVELSLATMLSLDHEVMIYDILIEKVHLINERKSPIEGQKITDFFKFNLTMQCKKRYFFFFVSLKQPPNV